MNVVVSQPRSGGPSNRETLHVLRLYWRGIMGIVLVSVVAVLSWTLTQPKAYTATASGIVTVRGAQDMSAALAGSELAESKATAYESLALSKPVVEAVINQLNLETSPDELVDSVSAETRDNTAEVHITATSDSPEAAAALADTWIQTLAEHVETVESGELPQAEAPVDISLRSLSSASIPSEPSSPRIVRNLTLSLLLGLVLGLAYAFVRHDVSSGTNTPIGDS